MEHEPHFDQETIDHCVELAKNEIKIDEINKTLDENPTMPIEETTKLNLQLNVLIENSSRLEEFLNAKGLTHHDAIEMGKTKIKDDKNFGNTPDIRASA